MVGYFLNNSIKTQFTGKIYRWVFQLVANMSRHWLVNIEIHFHLHRHNKSFLKPEKTKQKEKGISVCNAKPLQGWRLGFLKTLSRNWKWTVREKYCNFILVSFFSQEVHSNLIFESCLKVQFVRFMWERSIGRNFIEHIPIEVFTSVFHINCMNCYFRYPRMDTLYLSTLY